ncbi:MAG: Maf family protein [Chitinivorax sp.]
MSTNIYLASASPRRRELLEQLGILIEVLRTDIDETPLPGEVPLAYTERLARNKAEAGWLKVKQFGLPERPLLAADTTVVLDGTIIGKPESAEHARRILQQLSGREHQVLTSVALKQGERCALATTTSTVQFRTLLANEIDHYIISGEPMDKAGAYGIQGVAAMFVNAVQGSYTGIVGLPLAETVCMLREFGIEVMGA